MKVVEYLLGAILLAIVSVVGGVVILVILWFFWMLGSILFEIAKWTFSIGY